MLSLQKIKLICKQHGIAPSKSRGQNFLFDQNVIEKIVKAADLKKGDTVMEVGPGLGMMTSELLGKVKKVVAVELDKKLAGFLQVEFINEKNLEIVHQDILKVDVGQLGLTDGKYKIVANLPYNITSRFLRVFLDHHQDRAARRRARPSEMILMVQYEVAQRIVANPGKMSKLAVMIQFYSNPKILFKVGSGAFWPKPGVDSAMIYLKLKKKLPKVDIKKFFQVVNIGFSAKRKQLHNNLAGGLKVKSDTIKAILKDIGLREDIRAQELSIQHWVDLAKGTWSL